MENPLPAYPSRPPLPAIEITDTESTAPERLGAQSSGIRVANSSPRNSRSSFYFTPNDSESNLSTSTTGRPGEEGSDEDECIDKFLSDDTGRPLLNESSNSPIRLRRSVSHASIRTTRTSATLVSYGVLQLSMDEFCKLIRERRSLQRAEILLTETHCKMNGAIPHRFLLLKLHREGRKDLWLRLDRRRDRHVPFVFFAATFFATPAHDMAELARTREKLVGDATLENRQQFLSNPTLSELENLLGIFGDIIYRLLSTNCWFLPSQLQEYLGTRNGGYFVMGSQMHSNLAPDDRARIARRLASSNAGTPTSPRLQPKPLPRVKSLESISRKAAPAPFQFQSLAAVSPHKEKTPLRPRSGTDTSKLAIGANLREQGALGVDEILRRFLKMDQEIRTLCDQFAEHIARSRHTPLIRGSSWVVPKGTPLAELAVSVEDYVYFTTLSIVNREIYNRIFLPIHPAVAEDKSRPHGRQLNSVPPADAIIVRAKLFQGVDPQISLDRESEFIRVTSKTIQTEILGAMLALVDESSLPSSFTNDIQQILQSAYEWNRNIKQSTEKYAFTPFFVEPLSEWDPDRMESFERLRRMNIPDGSKIISSVSLGITGSRSHNGGKPRTPYVQQRAQVLVREWFAKNTRIVTSPPPRPSTPGSPPLRSVQSPRTTAIAASEGAKPKRKGSFRILRGTTAR